MWGTQHQYPDLEEVPSHVAILVNNKWVFQSTLEDGVHVMGYKEWLKINNEVAKIRCTQTRYYEDIKAMFKSLKGRKYDWGGVIYLGLWLGFNKVSGHPIPANNAWHSDSKYFCCEIMAKMTQVDYQMTTPVTVMMELKALINN
jgi:hypothetical protein